MNNKKVSIIIPAFNECEVIETTLANLDFNWIKEIIIVNDGSTDNTLEKVVRFKKSNNNMQTINLLENKGKGYAIGKGLQSMKGEVAALIDADLGDSVKSIDKLVQPVLNGEYEMTIAVLPIKGGGLGCVRKLADRGLQYITGQTMQAPLSGQRVLTKNVINEILPLSPGFGLEIGMDVDILQKGFSFKEIHCDLQHKHTGHTVGGYLHRWQQFKEIAQVLWYKYKRKQQKNS